MEMDLSNRHLVITGGTGTLGTEVCRQLLNKGAKVSIPCFTEAEHHDFELTDHKQVYTSIGVDLSSEDDTGSFFEAAVDQHGELWGSVHAAGGFGMASIEDAPLEKFLKQLNMNLITCYNACRTAILRMRQSDYPGGRIVNVAARPALEPRQGKGMTAYTTSKAAVAAFTQSLAAEVVKDNILVNAIAPSIIDTPANREAMPDADFSRWPKPEQLAKQILCLISPDNEITRGSMVTVYGKS